MKSCGLSWVRANCCGVGIKTENGDTFFYYDALDSLVIFVQEYDLNLIGGGWPPDWSPWKDDTTKWKEYFTTVLDRYNLDGDANDMPGLTKPIKYWEICNEPNGRNFCQTCYGGECCEHFRKYVRISSQAIKSVHPDCKVVAPSIDDARWYKTRDTWDDAANPVYWVARILEDSGAQYIDVLSHHYLLRKGRGTGWFSSYSEYLGCLEDTIEYHYNECGLSAPPLWLTEEGLTTCTEYDSVSEDSQAIYYREWSDSIAEWGWTEKDYKIFFFSLCWDCFGILDTAGYTHKPAYDTLRRVIHDGWDFWTGEITEDTRWEASDIYVTGDITIDGACTVTIDPGTTVHFLANEDDQKGGEDTTKCELLVNGTLNALGKSDSLITFTSSESDGWYWMKFENGDPCSLKHCKLECAKEGIEIDSTDVYLKNCEIRK
jgi:hypothetical protein